MLHVHALSGFMDQVSPVVFLATRKQKGNVGLTCHVALQGRAHEAIHVCVLRGGEEPECI